MKLCVGCFPHPVPRALMSLLVGARPFFAGDGQHIIFDLNLNVLLVEPCQLHSQIASCGDDSVGDTPTDLLLVQFLLLRYLVLQRLPLHDLLPRFLQVRRPLVRCLHLSFVLPRRRTSYIKYDIESRYGCFDEDQARREGAGARRRAELGNGSSTRRDGFSPRHSWGRRCRQSDSTRQDFRRS